MNTEGPPSPKQQTKDLAVRVTEWLKEQGFPTEFKTAHAFQRHEFRVFQGFHVRDDNSDAPREIDVLAHRDSRSSDHLVRVSHVVECKWSQNKPWVVFTSGNARIGNAACVAQTIGNSLGSTILWMIAGEQKLYEMDFFYTPARAGFSGRQAFAKGNDHFYSSMKSVTTLSSLLMSSYDQPKRPIGVMPKNAVLAFPVIVVDGPLFEAFLDVDTNQLQLNPARRIRCHWRGAPSWNFHATIDIVAFEYLNDFITIREQQVDALLAELERARSEIARCFAERSLESLQIAPAARGFLGVPPLLRGLRRRKRS